MTNVILRENLPSGARIISNTEVDAYNTCERKHMFGHGLFNKEPKRLSRSLYLGVTGHEILATFYKEIQHGMTKTQAYQSAMSHLTKIFKTADDFEAENLIYLQALLKRYFDWEFYSRTTTILGVEQDFYVPITNEYWYGLRLDLMLQHKNGRNAGVIEIVDHKFTYDFFTMDALKINPQLPKYVGAARFNGYRVKDATLNQLRTRFSLNQINQKSDEDLFKIQPVDVTDNRVKSSFKQQMKVSERIITRLNLPVAEQVEESVPVLNKMICQNCPFRFPCQLMEEGSDVTTYMETEFKKRAYGYNEET